MTQEREISRGIHPFSVSKTTIDFFFFITISTLSGITHTYAANIRKMKTNKFPVRYCVSHFKLISAFIAFISTYAQCSIQEHINSLRDISSDASKEKRNRQKKKKIIIRFQNNTYIINNTLFTPERFSFLLFFCLFFFKLKRVYT